MITIKDSNRQRTLLSVDDSGRKFIKNMSSAYGRALGSDCEIITISHNKRELLALEDAIKKHNNASVLSEKNIDIHSEVDRIIVAENEYKIGDEVNGNIIVNFGKSWIPKNSDFYSVHNINPSVSFVQYAYIRRKKDRYAGETRLD